MKDEAIAVCTSIYVELCCLIVGENFPAHPAERFVLNGKVKVMLTKVCSLQSRGVSGRHHKGRAELGPMPTWVVRMVAEFPRGVAGGRGFAPVRCPRGC